MPEKSNARRNILRKQCKGMDVPTLQKLLREKQIELNKRRIKQLAGGKFRAYTAEDKGTVPIKEHKRDIAVIQTFINQSMNKVGLPQKK